MIRKIFILLAFLLLLLGYAEAQQKKTKLIRVPIQAPIDVQAPPSIEIKDVKLELVFSENNEKLEKKLQLSFLLPSSLDVSQSLGRITLTAYKLDGSILGQHFWKGISKSVERVSNDLQLVVLNVNPSFEEASKYSLTVNNLQSEEATDCRDCYAAATITCGGRVQSVYCRETRDGTVECFFTCR